MFTAQDVSAASWFLDSYLNFSTGREHTTIVFYDRAWVGELFKEALVRVKQTKAVLINAGSISTPKATIDARGQGVDEYISILDLCCDTTYPATESSIAFTVKRRKCDVTTLEAARQGLTDDRLLSTLRKVFSCSLDCQARRADAFFSFLARHGDGYSIVVRSGEKRDAYLTIEDTEPWMEICGRLKETDVRFLPAAELFYSGKKVNGQFKCCRSAFSLLPLRSNKATETSLYNDLLELGKSLASETVTITIENNTVVSLQSTGSFADFYKSKTVDIVGLNYVVEVGIGLSYAALPLERNWGDTTNEAAAGVHVGLGADPTDTARFETTMHLDFVCPEVDVLVNGCYFFRDGKFTSVIESGCPSGPAAKAV